MPTEEFVPPSASVDLYWLPLGAGDNTHCVRSNGRIFEWVAALHQHRERLDLYHSALEVRIGRDRFVIEMAPGVERQRAGPRGSGRGSGGAEVARALEAVPLRGPLLAGTGSSPTSARPSRVLSK